MKFMKKYMGQAHKIAQWEKDTSGKSKEHRAPLYDLWVRV